MKDLEHVKILVVGDIMLDKYVVGDASRLSPEAPVPVVHVKNEYHTLGGCGNVVRNLRELGVQVDCMASVGLDHSGEKVLNELERIGAKSLCSYGCKETIVKERIIADERKVQMLRIDREAVEDVDHEKAIKILERDSRHGYDIIIVSDYAKGMINPGIMKYLYEKMSAKIIVDPKPIHGFLYNNAFMITPNEKEWSVMQLSSAYNLKHVNYVLETKGKDGMILHDIVKDQLWPIQAEEVNIYNVSGAGDTVVAIMAICAALEYPMLQAAMMANRCAQYVVTQAGTTTVPKHIFQAALDMWKIGD